MTREQHALLLRILDSIFFKPPYADHMTAGLVIKLCVIMDPGCRAFDAVCIADYCKEHGLCTD